MSDIRVISEYVLVNDISTNENYVSELKSGRIETNHTIQHAVDFSTFPIDDVKVMPLQGEWCEQLFVYSFDGLIWQCIQSHDRTEHNPIDIPALFRQYRAQGEEWVQPINEFDAYYIGDWCTFEGSPYTSLIDANVWSPTGYPAGWELREEI